MFDTKDRAKDWYRKIPDEEGQRYYHKSWLYFEEDAQVSLFESEKKYPDEITATVKKIPEGTSAPGVLGITFTPLKVQSIGQKIQVYPTTAAQAKYMEIPSSRLKEFFTKEGKYGYNIYHKSWLNFSDDEGDQISLFENRQ